VRVWRKLGGLQKLTVGSVLRKLCVVGSEEKGTRTYILLAAPVNTLISLMKATVLSKNSLYFIYSPGSFCFSKVYR
jgi:hypothetical protein